MSDWLDDPEFHRWAKDILVSMAPKLKASNLVMSIAPPDGDDAPSRGDVKYWVETGAAICMDKPIITVVWPGRALSAKLLAVSDEVVFLTSNDVEEPANRLLLQAAITRVLKENDDDGG